MWIYFIVRRRDAKRVSEPRPSGGGSRRRSSIDTWKHTPATVARLRRAAPAREDWLSPVPAKGRDRRTETHPVRPALASPHIARSIFQYREFHTFEPGNPWNRRPHQK